MTCVCETLSIQLVMKIDLLKNHQQHIPTLARWFKEESPDYFQDKSLEDVAQDQFMSRLNDDVLPVSFIAYEAELPVGTIALLEASVTTHDHLTPWLGGLHVHPEFRHRGIGSKLVQAGIEKAIALGFDYLYAGVSSAEDHYIARGWEIFEKLSYHGKPLSILRLDLVKGEV
jgi:GNAT superfamily N-acetyltransferase